MHRPGLPTWRLVRTILLALPALLVASPRIARAQTIDVSQEQSLPRLGANGEQVTKRPLPLTPEGVNRQDCLDDQKIRFQLLLTDFEQNAVLEAWASVRGSDCASQTSREGTFPTCWRVSPNIPLAASTIVDIPVRKLLSGAPPFTPAEPVSEARACGQVDLTEIAVQFLYFAPGSVGMASAKKEVVIAVDTVGPKPPTITSTLPGDHRVLVRWGVDGATGLTGISVFCDITTSGSAGADGGAPSCSTPNLATAVVPDESFVSQFNCGGVVGTVATTATATNVRGQPLVNRDGQEPTYAIAIAGVDTFRNFGPLSPPVCGYAEAPKPKDEEGGCTASGASLDGGSLLLSAGGVLVSVLVSRRRRIRKS